MFDSKDRSLIKAETSVSTSEFSQISSKSKTALIPNCLNCPIEVNSWQKVNSSKNARRRAGNWQLHVLKNWSGISFDPERNIPAKKLHVTDNYPLDRARTRTYVRTCALRAAQLLIAWKSTSSGLCKTQDNSASFLPRRASKGKRSRTAGTCLNGTTVFIKVVRAVAAAVENG